MTSARKTSIHDFEAVAINGSPVPLDRYRGKVLLIVNTASRCGFTPQYDGLQLLHEQLSARGFAVLAFPCNQFGGQEPGSESEIDSFCRTSHAVTFPMFAKVDVNGPHAHPLFAWLKHQAPGLFRSERIKWNFTKFLIDRNGYPVRRYAPTTHPEAIRSDIEALLAA